MSVKGNEWSFSILDRTIYVESAKDSFSLVISDVHNLGEEAALNACLQQGHEAIIM